MAKIEFCVRTNELHEMVFDGREKEARAKAISLLRAGFTTKPFLRFVANLLETPLRERGGPRRPPKRWLDIGEAFEQLRDLGISHQDAQADLAEKFGVSEATIGRAVKLYREAREEHDKATVK